jgi:phosphotransferase system HPr (HPr) family protein
VIGIAATSGDHIVVLSRLASILEDADLCDRLAHTTDAAEIHATLTSEAEPDDGETPGQGHAPDGIRRTTAITNPAGLHARPAAQIVARVQPFDAEVTIVTLGRRADARSITGLLGLGASAGDEVTVIAGGPDAEAALDAVMEIVLSGRDR